MKRNHLLATVALVAGLALTAEAAAQAADPADDPAIPCPNLDQDQPMKPCLGRPGLLGPGSGMMRGPGMRMMGRVDFYLGPENPLGLSEAQLAQLRTQAFAFRKAGIERRAALETAALELEQLRQATPIDAKKVEAKIREVGALRTELAVAAFQAQQQTDQVLTSEQREKASAVPCGRGPMMREWRKRVRAPEK
jgi:Spy/CpxP family protein refolding chaperone